MVDYDKITFEQITRGFRNYQELCNMFFSLTFDNEIRSKLEDILYNGKVNDFYFDSNVMSKNNVLVEVNRRLSMAYLLIRNPETFDILVNNNINLFHGTNYNALPSILNYGLSSLYESKKLGIDVSTGEKSTRIVNKPRSFVSMTDVLDIACFYSQVNFSQNKKTTFEVLLGTSVDDVRRAGMVSVRSDIPEVGVDKILPLEGIKIICVPPDKVNFVRRLVGNKNILVSSIDNFSDRFYYVDEDRMEITISYDEFNKLKEDLLSKKNNSKLFGLDEIRNFLIRHFKTKTMVGTTNKTEGDVLDNGNKIR